MAETAVNLVFNKLIPLLRDEAAFLRGVHGQITSIKDQLELIRAYLKDADAKAEKAETGELVKGWVRQMREVSFHIEDVVDEYLFKVASHPQIPEACACGVVQEIIGMFKTAIASHEVSSQIDEISKSIERLNQRREAFGFNPSAASESRNHAAAEISTGVDLRLGAHFIEEDQLVGVDYTKKVLNGWLLEEESRRTVISLVGEGGLGKTTIARNVYNKQKEKRSFDCYSWITVSRSLKGEHLLKTLMQSFYEEDGNKYAAKEIGEIVMNMNALITRVRGYLQGKRYMIVFDDVWDINFWEGVEFALLDSNSKIIITTRDRGVVEFCGRSALIHIHELEPLHPNDALNLFLLKAFQFDPKGCPKELMGLSYEFVKKCNGVPLAIVAIAGLLSTKRKIVSEWQTVYDSFRSKFSNDPHLRSFYQVLSESYYDLPYHLKLCLLYFGLFPEDYSITCVRLINLWIGEGFVKEKDNEGQTLEEVGEEYLTELIRRNLVKVAGVYRYGRVRRCRVHDLMHDFILKKCEEMNFCQVKRSEGFSINEWSRRLSIHTNIGDATMNYGRVRSCFVFNIQDMPTPVAESFFSSFKLLIGLDCEDAPLDYLPEAVGNLLHLKYLNLRNTKLKTIPKFIGKLVNLETLDLKSTLVLELPAEINRLIKLRHLLVYSLFFFGLPLETRHGVKLKEGFGNLCTLQKLAMVDVSDGDGIIRELKNLKQMRRLGICKLSRQNGKLLCSAIESMSHLCSLTIRAAEKHGVIDLQSLTDPPKDLQRLYLDGHLENFPEWIRRLKNLVTLALNGSSLMEDPLPLLKDLSELSDLGLYDSYKGDELHVREGWFMKLKHLRLQSPRLRTLKIDKGAMPHLEELDLGPCPQMMEVPADIQNLGALKRLYLRQMPRQFNQNIRTCKKENTALYFV